MKPLVWTLLVLSITIAAGLSLVASEAPDGLEHSMQQIGSSEGQPLHQAPMPDYSATWIKGDWAQKMVAGAAGVVLVFLTIWAAGRFLVKRPKTEGPIKGAGPWQPKSLR